MLRKIAICFVILALQAVLIFPNVFGLNGGHKQEQTQSRTVPGTFSREALRHLSKIFLPLEQHHEKPRLFGAQVAETEEKVPLNNDPVPASLFPKVAYSKIVMPLSEKYGVDWRLVSAVMEVESGYQINAISDKGAVGLMQVMPTTAALYRIKAEDLYDPAKNVEAGVRHLKFLTDRYAGNLELVIAAYNTGEGIVDHYHAVPPFPATRTFVKRVISRYNEQLNGN